MPLANTPFAFSLDVSNGPGSFGNEQQIDLLVAQNGAIYGDHVGATGIGPNPPAFYNVSFNGTMSPSSSTLLSGSGPPTPDFSGATTNRFGLGAYNSGTNGNQLTQLSDNDKLIISTSVPEPSPLAGALFATGPWWRRGRR
jgi:hypothetical protein